MPAVAIASTLETEAAFLADWSKGRPIVRAGTDTHSHRAGDWYQCRTWRVRLWPATVAALLAAGYADGTPDRFIVHT